MSSKPDPKPARADRARPRLRLLSPLRERDFALLWTGMTVSLIGDGIYFVAIAWLAYSISNTPTALSIVGVAWTLPTVLFVLIGGAVSDRLQRRRVLLVANLAEAIAIGLIGVLSLTGVLQMWMLLALVAIYGAGEAFFNPAFEAIVPTLIGPEEFTAASALDHFVRQFALLLIGPAIGGLLVAFTGVGVAFVIDAGTFLVSVCTLLAMRTSPGRVASAPRSRGARSARSPRGSGSCAPTHGSGGRWPPRAWRCLPFYGPYQVLLPFLVKNKLHAGGGTFGLIRAAGGVGAVLMAGMLAQIGLPRRCITVMFLAWTIQSLMMAGFAIAQQAWLFAFVSLFAGAMAALGNVIWGVLLKTLVPNELLGRVSSFDWLISIGLIPLSFAITGPIAEALGSDTTLFAAGLLSAILTVAFLAIPGLRDPERTLTQSALQDTGLARAVGRPAAVFQEVAAYDEALLATVSALRRRAAFARGGGWANCTSSAIPSSIPSHRTRMSGAVS